MLKEFRITPPMLLPAASNISSARLREVRVVFPAEITRKTRSTDAAMMQASGAARTGTESNTIKSKFVLQISMR
jgi:hypothetical protein